MLITDTIYIRNQIKANRRFDFKKLEKYGWAVLDYKKLVKEGIPNSDIRKTIKNLNIKRGVNEFQDIINVSKPIFNKNGNLAFIRVKGYCTDSPMYIYKKIDNRWIKNELDDWITKNDL